MVGTIWRNCERLDWNFIQDGRKPPFQEQLLFLSFSRLTYVLLDVASLLMGF